MVLPLDAAIFWSITSMKASTIRCSNASWALFSSTIFTLTLEGFAGNDDADRDGQHHSPAVQELFLLTIGHQHIISARMQRHGQCENHADLVLIGPGQHQGFHNDIGQPQIHLVHGGMVLDFHQY
jgi:hypothetical protein